MDAIIFIAVVFVLFVWPIIATNRNKRNRSTRPRIAPPAQNSSESAAPLDTGPVATPSYVRPPVPPARSAPLVPGPPRKPARPALAPGEASPETLAKVTELKKRGLTIQAIEVLREATGMELYEASQFVRKL